jgi:DNA invertase Pin-like site-specific DNA recombinase
MKRHASTALEAVLYARVSSEEQEKEGYSIPAQTKFLHGYAAEEGIKILHEFIDVETAKQPGRPGFMAMVEFLTAEAKKDPTQQCRTLLVEKTDRLYRNLKDYVTLDDLKVDVHFAKEGVILSPDSHSSEKFMHGIKVLMAKNYIDNLSEEVKKGMREKAEQGIPPNRVPLGYRNIAGPDERRAVALDEEIAATIRRMFEQYATGRFSLADIANMAKDEGLYADRGTDRIVATIYSILTNPFYYGEFRYRGKLYKGTYTPLITKDLWDTVQRVLRERGTRKPRKVKYNFAFNNLIRCGHCDCALVGEIKKGRYIYYRCTHYKGKCPEPYVRQEVLEERFTDILRSLTFDQEVLDWVTEALRQSHVDEKLFHDEAIDRLQKEYKRLQDRIDRMYIDKLDGRIDAVFFDTKSAEWRAEQTTILRSILEHQTANQSYLEEGVALPELASRAADLFAKQPASEKRRLLNFVLSNSTWANGVLTSEFRQPFDMLAVEVAACKEEKAAGVASGDLLQNRLPD